MGHHETEPDRLAGNELYKLAGCRHETRQRPLISFGADAANPSTTDYRNAVQAFHASHPQITEFTAWNEPNNSTTFASAAQAAGYLKALTDVCGGACTVAAGDFSGTRTPGTYFADYKTAVNALGLNPTLWAYHPYDVVDNATSDRFNGIQNFWSVVGANSPGISVWFTEVGAFKCIHGLTTEPRHRTLRRSG